MKDFEYANLNIVELNEFLRSDTKNYKDVDGSLCGRAYMLETETLEEDRNTVKIIEDQLKYEKDAFERKIAYLKEKKPESSGFFAKMSEKKKIEKEIKQEEKDHKSTMALLETRLKKHSKLFEDHKKEFSQICDKLKGKGFLWEELRRLFEEKLKRGVISFGKANKDKKPSVKKINPDEFEKLNPNQNRVKGGSGSSAAGGAKKKNDQFDPYDFRRRLDLSKLTPAELEELRKMMGRFNYNRDAFHEYEEAKRLRMSLFATERARELQRLSMNFSDYSLFRNLYNVLGPHRDPRIMNGLRSMWNGRPDPNFDSNSFLTRLTKGILRDSGYGLNAMDKMFDPTKRALGSLFGDPKVFGEASSYYSKASIHERNIYGHGRHFRSGNDPYIHFCERGMGGLNFTKGNYVDEYMRLVKPHKISSFQSNVSLPSGINFNKDYNSNYITSFGLGAGLGGLTKQINDMVQPSLNDAVLKNIKDSAAKVQQGKMAEQQAELNLSLQKTPPGFSGSSHR